jgi:predicted dehydrogenase
MKIIMAREKLRVGIIGANVRHGWGGDAHIPALSALPEFQITAVCTSRKETADETAKHFGISHAFAHPYKMVQHPDVDLVSICVRVPFHNQLGMAALNAASISTANGRLRPLAARGAGQSRRNVEDGV